MVKSISVETLSIPRNRYNYFLCENIVPVFVIAPGIKFEVAPEAGIPLENGIEAGLAG